MGRNGLNALLNYALPVVVAAIIWIYADKLAKLALARPQQIVFDSDITSSEWQALAFSVVGLWQTVAAIIGLSFRAVQFAYLHHADTTTQINWDAKSTGTLLAECVQLVIGLALLFGARGLVGLIRRYREVGHPHSDAIESSDTIDADATKPDPTPPA